MTRLLAALLLATLPALSAAQTDERVVKPEIRVGDSWTYRSTNVLAPGTHEHETRVTFVDEKLVLAVSTRKGDSKEYDSSWTREWNPVTSYAGLIYRPHGGFFRFPMRPGDAYEWTYESVRPRETNVFSSTKWKAKVVGWDIVEVPAGKFRAMKVETEGATESFDGTPPFPIRAVLWYEPEVRRWVKYQFDLPKSTRTEELLRYKLNEDKAAA